MRSVSVFLHFLAVAALVSTTCVVAQFDFAPYGTIEFEADCTVAALVAPLTFATNGGNLTAPAGTFLIFGDVFGAAILPAASSNSATANTTFVAGPVANYGAVGCAQRKGTNRFYLLGTPVLANVLQNMTGDVYYNYASNDGVTWTNVLDAATTALWRNRFDDDFTMCVVDLSNNVYSVGSATTWISSNQGVTFTLVPVTGSRFSNRTYFAGGIFTSQITGGDKVIVAGGRDAPTAANIYGGNDHNDVRNTFSTPGRDRHSSSNTRACHDCSTASAPVPAPSPPS
jgi:hypothetical protein